MKTNTLFLQRCLNYLYKAKLPILSLISLIGFAPLINNCAKIYGILSLIIFTTTILCQSCNNVPLDNALKYSKENRHTLEEVIKHFSQNPSDSLKLEASQYLIENMLYHKAAITNEQTPIDIVKRFRKVDSIVKSQIHGSYIIPDEIFQHLFKELENNNLSDKQKWTHITAPDIEFIDSKYLINHINYAFSVWESSPFCKQLNKEAFFLGILPYRICDEPLEMDISYDEIFHDFAIDDSLITKPEEIVVKVNNYLNGFAKYRDFFKSTDIQGFYGILNAWSECKTESIYTTKIFRSMGIPAFVEFTPQWKHFTAGVKHYWCTVKDKTGLFEPFSAGYQQIKKEETRKYFKDATKIFRYTYKINCQTPFFLKKEDEFIPEIFDTPYIEDVTNNYFATKKIKVKLSKDISGRKLCYLATFNPPAWNPVDFALLKKHEVGFSKVQTNCIYAVIAYTGKKNRPEVISKPFYVHENGNIEYINANLKETQKIRLFQKFPQKDEIRKHLKNLMGTKFQAANNPEFKNSEEFYEITEIPKPIMHSIKVKSGKKYRYVRMIVKPEYSSFYVAHVEYHTKKTIEGKTEKGLSPYLLSPVNDDSIKVLQRPTRLLWHFPPTAIKWLQNAALLGCDGNFNTYCICRQIPFDFGEPVEISEIRYAPRNANNWVEQGDRYVLYYYNNDWVAHDTITAKYNFVEFENVPANTLYWLKDISKGKEELAFVYYKNKQLFINKDNLNQVFTKNEPIEKTDN